MYQPAVHKTKYCILARKNVPEKMYHQQFCTVLSIQCATYIVKGNVHGATNLALIPHPLTWYTVL